MTRPAWSEVPKAQVDRFAAVALGGAQELAEEILGEIRREYPHLKLVEDESGEPMALVGIRRAIEGFVHNLASGAGHPRVPPEVFQEFGRGEGRDGRSLDSLQATYRLGVRLAWRRFAEIGQQVDIAAPAMYELAESGFEYLDGLVEQSVRGYAEAAARRAGERLRLQRQLIDLLLVEHRGDPPGALAERAARISWELPTTVAVGVLVRPAREAVAPAVEQGILLDMESEQPRVVIPEPCTAGRAETLRRATAGWSGAVGPPVPLAAAATSLRWAETAVRLVACGLLPDGEVLNCTERTEELVLLPSGELIDAAARRCLAPLEGLAPTQSRRLAETLLAWMETAGGAPEVAQRLGIHPQTARYRLRQIRELWGDVLEDADRRFEMLLVLRARRLRGELSDTADREGRPRESVGVTPRP
ncbi:helix-turn-helix domain-containing protein [Streptomyces xantholiticus]|uniref:PucR family transcriptional regulator n=1 Tax=Streptomyces xantholiticus TaxID=68285 RepID=UPI00167B5A40|nr:helix-turn-helix domain-containing protein [Streptomyces xantholiticus]